MISLISDLCSSILPWVKKPVKYPFFASRDLNFLILRYLSAQDLIRFSCVSLGCKELAEDDRLWKPRYSRLNIHPGH